MKEIIAKSGVKGWEEKLQKVYKDFEDFEAWCDLYKIHERLGYKTPSGAWRGNPVIQGSVNPSDLCSVSTRGYVKKFNIERNKNGTKTSLGSGGSLGGACAQLR